MKLYFSPNNFHFIAQRMQNFQWKLLMLSALLFVFYLLLQNKINALTPITSIWLTLFFLFSALQMLVFSAFIFFFQTLHSSQTNNTLWAKFYQTIEWSEAILFFVLLPLPSLTFLYSIIRLN